MGTGRELFVRLIHWNAAEAEERGARLRAEGFGVEASVPRSGAFFRDLGKSPPDVLVIDLGRLPSQGRDVAVGIRQQKSTRKVPIVFVAGDPAKVEGIRKLLPDMIFTDWEGLPAAIRDTKSRAASEPLVPKSRMAAYEGAPLHKKLGLKPGYRVSLLDPPPGHAEIFGALPEGATIAEGPPEESDLALWFVRTAQALEEGIAGIAEALGQRPLWICWPKRTSGLPSDLTQQAVREAGLARGLVDYKICSIDDTWSGLLFRRRKALGPGEPRPL